jgi:hypothetical protein
MAMSESTVETTTSGPSLESILWAAAERWNDTPGLVDRDEFADYIFDAWGAESPTEDFVARFFDGDPTVARPSDMAEAVARASRSQMHVYNFDLNRLEYVVIEDAEQVVLVSDQGQFALPNDDFFMRAIERAIIPGSKDPVATGGEFDRKQDGTPRGYFVRRSGEIVAVDVDKLSKTVQQLQLDLKPVFSPIVEDAEGRLMPFKPTRTAMMPNREVELLRQDERISTWTLPKRNTLVSPVMGNDGLSMTAGSVPGLNAPASAAAAVLLLLPDGTLARPVIGSASRWRDMVSDWTMRAAMISIDATQAPAAVMDDRRYAVQTDRVVAVFSGVRQTTNSPASIGEVGLTSQTRGEAIAAVRMLDANIRVLGDDDLAAAILGGAQFVSGLAAPIMAEARAGTGFWLQPEIIFAPSSNDRAYASREMDLRSAGFDNASLESMLQAPQQEMVAVQGPTSDPWSNWALSAGDSSPAAAALIGRDVEGGTLGSVMDPSAMALFAKSNRKIGSTVDGTTSNFAIAGSDTRPGQALRIPSERIVAFRAPDGAIVYQPQANSQVRLASVHRSIGSNSDSASYTTQRGAPAPRQFSATIGARSGAMPATALAALATALDRTAAASGYKLPRVVSFESADDAISAGQYLSGKLSESSPRRSQAMLTETPILSGSVGRMVLSMPFPSSGEVVVGPDLDEALKAWMVAPAVSVGDGTSAMGSSSFYSSAASGGSASGRMLGSFGGAASGAMAGGLALRGGPTGAASYGYSSSALSGARVVSGSTVLSAGNPSIPSSAFVSGGAGAGAVAAPADFAGGSFVSGGTYAASGALPGAVVSNNAGGVSNFGSPGSAGSSFASPDLSGDASGFSAGIAGGGGTVVQGPNGVSYVVQSVPGAGAASSRGSASAPSASATGMGPNFAGVDLGTAHREAIGQATQASFVMQMPAASQTLSSRASLARLPRLLSTALNASGQWLPGSGTPLPSAVRDFAMSGPFDWPELAQIGASPQEQELPSGVSTRVLNPGEEEIQIPMPLWAQMGRGQLSSTEAVMASPRMQPGFAPPLGMYRLVKPPEVDFANGAPEGTPGVMTLQGPTELGLDRSPTNAVEASKGGTSFVLGRIPISDGETVVSRRGRIKIGAPLGSSGDAAAAGSTFSGDTPSSFSALSSMGQAGSFATGGASAGSSLGSASPDMTSAGASFGGSSQASGVGTLGGDAPTGTLVTSNAPITTLRVPSFETVSDSPDLAAASNAPSASGRPFAGALRSALRMSDDVGSRMMPATTGSVASFSSSGASSGSSTSGFAPSTFSGASLVAGQPNFGSGGGVANGVGGSGFGGSSSLVSSAPQGSFVAGGGSAGSTSSNAFSNFSAGSSGAGLVSGASATSGSNGAGAPGVSGLPIGAWSGANRGNVGYTPWVYGSRYAPAEQSRGGVDINSGSRLGKPSYPSLPGMLRFKYIGAPLWWSSATGNAMSSPGTADSSGSDTGAVSRSLSSGLQAANSAASIWRSVFVSPGNQQARSRGSRSTSDAGSMDNGWDSNADSMASLSSKMSVIALGMGGGAAAATAGSAASKLTGPETVYVAMDSSGRGGMTTGAQAGSTSELNMKIVAAIPPSPPPLADMAAASSTGNAVRPRHSKAHAGHHDEHKDEGGVSRGKIEGSVDAIAQRIYHRIVRRLDSDRERFGG